jgi:CheY-like chemotaxis protein/anti-sigma regulatory factor (Ser/Thr protein kinase)
MKFKADEKGIGFTSHISDAIPKMLNGDPLRISQILMNLVNNAIKFTHKGKVKINVELVDRYESTVRIIFKVSDTGIGISNDGKLLLFKEFSQSESSTSRKYGGTGLGLAISKNLVSLMNGEIHVESELGKGSEFWFRLPLKESTALNDEETEKVDRLPQGIKILLADDNLINQKVAVLTLKQLGYECDIANDGLEAFRKYEENRYDLILMDMQMPEVDGLQATRMIREFEFHEHILLPAYVVALTANALAEDKQLCFSVGMNNFMSKPFTEGELRQILIEVARRQRK